MAIISGNVWPASGGIDERMVPTGGGASTEPWLSGSPSLLYGKHAFDVFSFFRVTVPLKSYKRHRDDRLYLAYTQYLFQHCMCTVCAFRSKWPRGIVTSFTPLCLSLEYGTGLLITLIEL